MNWKTKAVTVACAAASVFGSQAEACIPWGAMSDYLCGEDRLLQNVLPFGENLAEHNISVGGWVNGGVTLNTNSPDNRYNGPNTFNHRANDVQFNQGFLYVNRRANAADKDYDFGFAVDFFFGSDAEFAQVRHFDSSWDVNDNYGFAMPQLYGEVAAGDFSVIAGHFYTLVGYEAVPATDNFFYSHAYTAQYGEPFTHTGVLATYQGVEDMTLYGGYTTGWDSGFGTGFQGGHSFVGGVAAALSEDTNVRAFTHIGERGVDTTWGPRKDLNLLFTGTVDHKFNEDTRAAAHATYGRQSEAGGDSAAHWFGLAAYATQVISDSINGGVRFEYFYDSNGVIPRNSQPGPAFFDDFSAHYISLTTGLNVRPCDSIVIRPELRWDWVAPESGSNIRPFDSGDGTAQFTFGVDAILTY